jgi:DNA invertase Pin-like site-specific DNA recombinase
VSRVFSYERVSSQKQIQGRGLERQSGGAEEWCRERGLQLDTSLDLTDPGLSAYHGEHLKQGALGRFLALAQAGELGPEPILLVEAVDRLSRLELLDGVQDIVFQLLRSGVQIHTLEDGARYTKATVNNDLGSAIQLIAKIFAAAEYSKRLSRRITDTWTSTYEGMAEGKLPRGRRLVPAWCLRDDPDGPVRLDPGKAAAIRRVFELSRDDGATVVAKRLNAEKVPYVIGGGPWARKHVNYLLNDPRVYGALRINRKHSAVRRENQGGLDRGKEVLVFPDLLPLVVTKEEFDAVAACRAARTNAGERRGPTGQMLFVGQRLVRCVCGSSCTVVHTFSGKWNGARRPLHYVKCRRRGEYTGGCKSPGYTLTALNAHVLTRLRKGQLQQLMAADTQRSSQAQAEQEAIAKLSASLAQAQQREANAARLFKQALLDGRDDPLYREAVEEARADATSIDKALSGARERLAGLRREVDTTEFDAALEELFTAFASGADTPAQRQRINAYLRRAGVTITLDNDRRRVGMALAGGEPVWQPFDPSASTVALATKTTDAVYRDHTITEKSLRFLEALDPGDPGWAAWLRSMKGVTLTSVTSLPPGWEQSEWAKAAKQAVAAMPPEVQEALRAMREGSDLGGAPAVADAHVDLEGDL